MIYLSIALDEVVDGGDAPARDEIIETGLLLWGSLGGWCMRLLFAGHSIDDVVYRLARTFLYAFQGCIGGGAHGLASQRLGGGGGKHPSGQTGDRIEKTFSADGILSTISVIHY